ncbi:hypothetical protein D3C78_1357520 [compost metagenome]
MTEGKSWQAQVASCSTIYLFQTHGLRCPSRLRQRVCDARAGISAIAPEILLALWLYATLEGELDRLLEHFFEMQQRRPSLINLPKV